MVPNKHSFSKNELIELYVRPNKRIALVHDLSDSLPLLFANSNMNIENSGRFRKFKVFQLGKSISNYVLDLAHP